MLPFSQRLTVTPSATANTLGAAVSETIPTVNQYNTDGPPNAVPAAKGFVHEGETITTSGVGTETVTVQAVATLIDGTVITATTTFTTNTTQQNPLYPVIAQLGLAANGVVVGINKLIVSISWSCKSSIAGSAASVTVNTYEQMDSVGI